MSIASSADFVCVKMEGVYNREVWILYLIIYLTKQALGSTETVLNVSCWTCHDYLCLKMKPMFFCGGTSGDGCD